MMTGAEPHRWLDDDEKGVRIRFQDVRNGSDLRIPGRSDDEAADGDRAQLRLRARGPVFVLDVDRFDEQMRAEGRCERVRSGIASVGLAKNARSGEVSSAS